MKAKEYFLRVQKAETELRLIRAQIQHYDDLGRSISGRGISGMPMSHSRGSSRVETAAIGIYDATRALEEEAKQYSAIIESARQVISQISQEKYRQILTYRYLCNWSFRSISDEMHYIDQNSVYRAHGWALAEAQKILNNIQRPC